MIQPGKNLIFGNKPKVFLKVGLFGVGKKFVPLMQGFRNSGEGWGLGGGGRIPPPEVGRES